MAKKDNRKLIATPAVRRLFSDIRAARQHGKEWSGYEGKTKDALLSEVDLVDVTFVTEDGAEVGSITETDPSQTVDWSAFRAAHPELEDEFRKFLKPATTTVRVLTNWVEPTA